MGEYSGSSPMGDGRNVAGSKYSGDAKTGKGRTGSKPGVRESWTEEVQEDLRDT